MAFHKKKKNPSDEVPVAVVEREVLEREVVGLQIGILGVFLGMQNLIYFPFKLIEICIYILLYIQLDMLRQ